MPRCRSGYSFKTAVGSLEEVIARQKAVGASVGVISDRCSTFGWTRYTKLAKEAGLRPVYGVELACVPRLGEKKPSPSYWTFLATMDIKDVHGAIAQATANFAKEPMLTYGQALALPGLIKIADEKLRVHELPEDFDDETYPDFYVALSPSTPKGLIKRVNDSHIRWIASSDNYYPHFDDLEFYRVAMGSRRGGTQTYPRHIMSDQEWGLWMDAHLRSMDSKRGWECISALDEKDKVLDRCRATMRSGKLLSPPKPQTLEAMCLAGAQRLGIDRTNEVYWTRLARELKLIQEKGFEDYFYIVADLVAWAKKVMVVGPGRGSSAGSLVCYLLGITAIDPIPHDLLFERFIDINRADLPDIDIDFDDTKRNLVFRYAEEKYGKERVARLGTVGFFKEKSAMNQVCSALSIPKWKAEEDRYRVLREYPEAAIVDRLEDHPSHSSQHAAGLLLTDQPVTDYVAVDSRTRAAWCDKKDAENLNLLKVDILGLTQLSVFGRTLELIGKPGDSSWLETIPTDDPAAFAVLNRRAFSGIFQFNGHAVQGLAKGITFETLDDIVAIGALARPGPLDSGGAHLWVKRRAGAPYEEHQNPTIREITKPTQGVIVYQESVMRIVREIGNFSWDDTSKFRRLIQYKENLESFEEKLVAGAISNGFSPYDAKALWEQLVTYGAYGFNKCIDGDTPVYISNANKHLKNPTTIAQLYDMYEAFPKKGVLQKKLKPQLLSLFPDGRGRPQKAIRIIKSGAKACNRYDFDDGSHVICTPDHRFIVEGGWLRIGDAPLGAVFSGLRYERQTGKTNGRGKGHSAGSTYGFAQEGFPQGEDNPSWVNGVTTMKNAFIEKHQGQPCVDCGQLAERMEAHHEDFKEGRERPDDLTWLCVSCHKKRHYAAGRVKRWEKGHEPTTRKLVSITRMGERETYDIEMPEHHNFALGNGLITHNSHAVAYGLVGYWCCYLKAHHPTAFAAATLDSEPDPAKQIAILRELGNEGVGYMPIDPDRSAERWTPSEEDGILIGPLTTIKGIGPGKLQEILDARRRKTPLRAALQKQLANAKTSIDSLFPIRDAIRKLHPDLSAINILTEPTDINDVEAGLRGDVLVMGVVNRVAVKDENGDEAVQKRGYRLGPMVDKSLNIFLADDSGEVLAKIDRRQFHALGAEKLLAELKPGKSLIAAKGQIPGSFRMIGVSRIRVLGEMS